MENDFFYKKGVRFGILSTVKQYKPLGEPIVFI